MNEEEVHTSGLLNRYTQRSPSLENILLADWVAYTCIMIHVKSPLQKSQELLI